MRRRLGVGGIKGSEGDIIGACFGREDLPLAAAREAAREAAVMMGLGDRLDTLASSLTTAGKKRLELARALSALIRSAMTNRSKIELSRVAADLDCQRHPEFIV